MSVDDAPEEGFVRDNKFLHPLLKFGFTAPRDFRLFNDQDGVLGVGRDHSLLFFSCTKEPMPGSLAEWMRNKLKPTPTDIQSAEIDGVEAAIGARPRGSDTGLGQVRYVMVRHGDQVCYFNLLSEGPDRDRRIEVLVAAARTFRTLSDAEAAALHPYRLRVITPNGASAAQLAQRLPYGDFKMERLLVLNGVDSAAELARLRKLCAEAGRDYAKMEISIYTDAGAGLSAHQVSDEAARKMVREYEEAGAHRMIFLARQPGNEFLTDLEQMARRFIAPA